MNLVFTNLIAEASSGSIPALSQLMLLSFNANTFIAMQARRLLRDHFNIKTEN